MAGRDRAIASEIAMVVGGGSVVAAGGPLVDVTVNRCQHAKEQLLSSLVIHDTASRVLQTSITRIELTA